MSATIIIHKPGISTPLTLSVCMRYGYFVLTYPCAFWTLLVYVWSQLAYMALC